MEQTQVGRNTFREQLSVIERTETEKKTLQTRRKRNRFKEKNITRHKTDCKSIGMKDKILLFVGKSRNSVNISHI
jgi:hypothetical protein